MVRAVAGAHRQPATSRNPASANELVLERSVHTFNHQTWAKTKNLNSRPRELRRNVLPPLSRSESVPAKAQSGFLTDGAPGVFASGLLALSAFPSLRTVACEALPPWGLHRLQWRDRGGFAPPSPALSLARLFPWRACKRAECTSAASRCQSQSFSEPSLESFCGRKYNLRHSIRGRCIMNPEAGRALRQADAELSRSFEAKDLERMTAFFVEDAVIRLPRH